MKKISFGLNIILILFFIWYFFIHVGLNSYYQKYVSPKEPFMISTYYKEKVKGYQELNKRLKPQVEYCIFIGDSLIEQFPAQEILLKGSILNRGISLDSTVGLVKRLEDNANNIDSVSKCFLLIGRNDLAYRTDEEISRNIVLILSKVKANKRYFISLLPCNDARSNARVRVINEMVKSGSEKGEFEYIDVYHLFEGEGGKVKEEYFYDGVHLNVPGYLRLKEALDQYVN